MERIPPENLDNSYMTSINLTVLSRKEVLMHMRNFVIAAALALLLSCGSNVEDEIQGIAVDAEPAVLITMVDSIGAGSGDSLYVMGGVEGVAFGPDGNIVILDCGRSCVRIYCPGGEFLRSISRRGNGPGELQAPTFMALSENGMLYVAGTGGELMGVHCFDYFTGDWLDSFQTFVPPSCLEGAEDSLYVRKTLGFAMINDEPMLLVDIEKFGPAPEPLVTYYSDSIPLDLSDESGLIELDWYGYDIAVGSGGQVFVAPRSTETALVIAFSPDGDELSRFRLDLERTARTPEEMDMALSILRAKAISSNENPAGMEADPYKPMIRGLEVDADGNLWVLQGGPTVPTFSVLDASGRFLFNARVEGEPADGSTWRFHMGGDGILAYAEDPISGFQKVYILEAVEVSARE